MNAYQKSSTILFLIFFISYFLLSISSWETFTSVGSEMPMWVSWIPSSCKTIDWTWWTLPSYSNIFFLSSSFFFRIFYLCYTNLFFRSSWDYKTFYSCLFYSIIYSCFFSSTFYSKTIPFYFAGCYYFISSFFFWPFRGGRDSSSASFFGNFCFSSLTGLIS